MKIISVIDENASIILTATVRNFLPASGKICAMFSVNTRMWIHTELVF